MAKYLIKNGTVWDGERFLAADVLTENDRVVAIQPNITEKVNYTFDAAGCIVSAGLVDANVHVVPFPLVSLPWPMPAEPTQMGRWLHPGW